MTTLEMAEREMTLVAPHGGTLVQRTFRPEDAADGMAKRATMPALTVTEHALADLVCLGTGVYSPLQGFMTRCDYWRVLDEMRLATGPVWTVPITLPVPPERARHLRIGQPVALVDRRGGVVGTMRVEDVFERDAEEEAQQLFRTRDPRHPGVARLYGEPHVLVGGAIRLLMAGDRRGGGVWGEGAEADGLRGGTARGGEIQGAEARGGGPPSRYMLTPKQTRAAFARRGWRRVVGFQTRNPVHRAHEYIQKCALEIVDGLLLHPLVGATKEDDVPAPIRLRSYEVLLQHYYPPDRVLLAGFPAAMRYAGPREAVFHALCRKNYGCSHFIVGRDHAGVGQFYGTYDAQRIFDEFAPDELGITPLFFEHAFYCRRCGGMATTSTCGHGTDDRVTLSGSAVRQMLRLGQLPPPEFTRPEVARVLAEAFTADSAAAR